METEEFRRQAASFGEVADLYERSRPDYPAVAVTWLAGDRPARVLDLAAGTGKLTRMLVAAGHDVTAVDPSESMLAHVRRDLPAVEARVGTAESLPLDDASVDVVTVAQAFHWFDVTAALTEIARVLVPGGRLGLVWNLADRSTPWVDELWNLINPREPSDIAAPTLPDPFGPAEAETFDHAQRLTRTSLLDLVGSRSYVAIRPADERTVVLDETGTIYDRYAGADGLVLRYVTRCFRTHRR